MDDTDGNIVDLKALADKRREGVRDVTPAAPAEPQPPTYAVSIMDADDIEITGWLAMDPNWIVFMDGPGDIGRMIPADIVTGVIKISDG